jgi:hypothetical protein
VKASLLNRVIQGEMHQHFELIHEKRIEGGDLPGK